MCSLEFDILKKSLARPYSKLLVYKVYKEKIKSMKCGYNLFFFRIIVETM